MKQMSLWLVSFFAAGAAVDGSLLLVGAAPALVPVSEFSVVSRALLTEPLDIEVSGLSDLEMAQVTIEPGGTSGTRRYAGPALVSIVGGTATRYQVDGGSCRSTTVLPGVAYVVAHGEIDETRNDGASPLHLQTTSLAPAGELWATSVSPPAGCGAATAKGYTVRVLSHTSMAGPARIKTDGPSDILVGGIVIPPRTSGAGWHYHSAAVLVSVERGRLPRPAVYVTSGTVPVFSTPQLLRLAVEALAPLATVVVTTGPNAPEVIAAGDQVHVEQYLPQSQVLPRVDLVVSHGGAGTTIGALSHAVPHLVVPRSARSSIWLWDPVVHSYPGFMKRNVTVQLDDEVIRAAKVLAAKRGTSVSGLVAAELARLVAEEERYEEAWRRARKAMGDAAGRGGRRWQRDELHER